MGYLPMLSYRILNAKQSIKSFTLICNLVSEFIFCKIMFWSTSPGNVMSASFLVTPGSNLKLVYIFAFVKSKINKQREGRLRGSEYCYPSSITFIVFSLECICLSVRHLLYAYCAWISLHLIPRCWDALYFW